jgi:N-dimethylarginine dimethylaminohydrolase
MYIRAGVNASNKMDYRRAAAKQGATVPELRLRARFFRLLARPNLPMPAEIFTNYSMTGDLQRVLVCPPRNAGWDRSEKVAAWREVGFHHSPDSHAAQRQHENLCRLLTQAGAEVVCLPPSDALTLDAVYAHDASLPTDYGLILMNPGKTSRTAEAQAHANFCSQLGIPVFGEIHPPGTSETGDIVWLDPKTLLIGHGYRTNKAGIDQMGALLSPKGVVVLSAPLPYGPGPSACLHLMSLMSMLDERTILVDLPWLAVETVELLKGRGFRLIEIEYSERDTLACNVLSLGSKRLVAIEQNARTNRRLRDSGFDVRTFPGSEICINGSGGPTCLTRPLLRR